MMGFLKKGRLNLVVGNVEAYKMNQRGLTIGGEQIDMNRCIGLDVGMDSYEFWRQKEFSPLLNETDLLLDVHATQESTPYPFLMVPEVRSELAHCLPLLGINRLIEGAYNPSGSIAETDLYVSAHGGLGVTIEAGWREDPGIWRIVFGVLGALQKLGMIDLGIEFPVTKLDKHYETVKYVNAGRDFVFTKRWEYFELIPPFMVYAYSDGVPLYEEEEVVIIFAKEKVVEGMQACLIARKA